MNNLFILAFCYCSTYKTKSPKIKNTSTNELSKENFSRTWVVENFEKRMDAEASKKICKKRWDLYRFMGNSEIVEYNDYVLTNPKFDHMHDLILFSRILTHWNQLKYIDNLYPSEEDKKSSIYRDLEKEIFDRYNIWLEKIKRSPNIPSRESTELYPAVTKSDKIIYEDKQKIVKKYGVNINWSVPQKIFFEEFTIQNISYEMHQEVVIRAKIDCIKPDAGEIKELARILKIYAQSYKNECSDNDFNGLTIVYKSMVKIILMTLKFDHIWDNMNPDIHCSLAFFTTDQREACRILRHSFSYLTFLHMKYIVEGIKI